MPICSTFQVKVTASASIMRLVASSCLDKLKFVMFKGFLPKFFYAYPLKQVICANMSATFFYCIVLHCMVGTLVTTAHCK